MEREFERRKIDAEGFKIIRESYPIYVWIIFFVFILTGFALIGAGTVMLITKEAFGKSLACLFIGALVVVFFGIPVFLPAFGWVSGKTLTEAETVASAKKYYEKALLELKEEENRPVTCRFLTDRVIQQNYHSKQKWTEKKVLVKSVLIVGLLLIGYAASNWQLPILLCTVGVALLCLLWVLLTFRKSKKPLEYSITTETIAEIRVENLAVGADDVDDYRTVLYLDNCVRYVMGRHYIMPQEKRLLKTGSKVHVVRKKGNKKIIEVYAEQAWRLPFDHEKRQ